MSGSSTSSATASDDGWCALPSAPRPRRAQQRHRHPELNRAARAASEPLAPPARAARGREAAPAVVIDAAQPPAAAVERLAQPHRASAGGASGAVALRRGGAAVEPRRPPAEARRPPAVGASVGSVPGSVAPNAPHATRAAPPVAAHSWMATVSDARSGGGAESASSAQWTQTYRTAAARARPPASRRRCRAAPASSPSRRGWRVWIWAAAVLPLVTPVPVALSKLGASSMSVNSTPFN